MTAIDIIVTILGLAVIAGSTVIARQYISSRAEKANKAAELAARVRLSEQETTRWSMFAEAMSRQRRDAPRV